MEQKFINPWKWLDGMGYVSAVQISAGQRVLYCAGQSSIDAEGKPLHLADMRAQIVQSFDNLEAVLKEWGFRLSEVARLNYYTTDVELLIANLETVKERLTAAGCRPGSTILGVSRLVLPELMVEIEATAIRS